MKLELLGLRRGEERVPSMGGKGRWMSETYTYVPNNDVGLPVCIAPDDMKRDDIFQFSFCSAESSLHYSPFNSEQDNAVDELSFISTGYNTDDS